MSDDNARDPALARRIAPDTVRLERLLDAPIETVWRFLTDAELRGRWFMAGPLDPRPGGDMVFRIDHGGISPESGEAPDWYAQWDKTEHVHKVLAIDPPRLLRFTWEEGSEVSWLLEPAALIDAAPRIPRDELVTKQSHVAHLKDGHKRPRLLERIEEELHIELTARCRNSQLKYALRRSQLPLFATHSTYRRFQDAEEIVRMAGEHWSVFDHLLAGDAPSAAKALEAHLKRSMEHNTEVLKLLPRLPDTPLPDYLVPIKLSRD